MVLLTELLLNAAVQASIEGSTELDCFAHFRFCLLVSKKKDKSLSKGVKLMCEGFWPSLCSAAGIAVVPLYCVGVRVCHK